MKKILKFFAAFLLILPIVLISVSCKKESSEQQGKPETVIALLGSQIPYWNQIRMGIEHEALGKNLQIVTIFHEADTTKNAILNVLHNLGQYENLRGIILGAGDSVIDKTVAMLGPKQKIIAVDQKPADFSPISPLVSSSIIVDNIKIAKDISSKIKEKQLVCISYTMGGSVDRSNAFVSASGKKVYSILANDAKEAANQLQDFINSHEIEEFAVFFATGSFINEQTIGMLKNRNVYTMDMNLEIEKFIREDLIRLAIVPNTYDMGAKAVKTLFNPGALPNQYVSILYANKENIESDSIRLFLK